MMKIPRVSRKISRCIAAIWSLLPPLVAFSQAAGEYDKERDECTAVIAVGKSTVDGKTRTGQNHDGSPWMGEKPSRTVKISVDKKSGIKTIGELNSAGVARQGNNRRPRDGMDGGASTFADPNEAYIVEYAFVIKDHPGVRDIRGGALAQARTAREAVDACTKSLPAGSYRIIGPLRDQTFGHANAYLAPELLALQIQPGYSKIRGARIQELLQPSGQSRDAEESTAGGKISTLYLFRVLRRHDTPWSFESSWVNPSDGTGNICRWGYDGISRNADVKEISSDYPDLLSIYWSTPHFPALGPFLPFFIGLTRIPPAFAEGETNQSDVFRELFNAVLYKTNYADDLQRFWESFDLQTVSELMLLESDVKTLAGRGDRKGAEAVLHNFSNGKCELAVTYAKQLLDVIVAGRPITDVRVRTALPKRPTWE